jgi:hypothetical protein
MSLPIHSFPAEVRASAKIRAKRDSADSCRERASMDLLKSVAMITANERLILERSAAIWAERALLLDRAELIARARPGAAPNGLTA